jgi:hypothetical protein
VTKKSLARMSVISGFCHKVDKNLTLLGYYTLSNSNFYQRFGTIYQSHLQGSRIPQESLSQNVGKKLPLLAE